MSLLGLGLDAVERGLVPDTLTRMAIRRLCRQRLRESRIECAPAGRASNSTLVEAMRSAPIAPLPERANEQHYELPPDFFATVLGPRRKYSCCYWGAANTNLAGAEEAALSATCERAELADGQRILELGCGWGSLSLWMAERYRHSRITAVSNSTPQRLFIESQAELRGITNLQVVTADVNDFSPPPATRPENSRDPESMGGGFDRVVSVEMFEHLRNYERLLSRIAQWLRPDGKLFVHIFCHRELAYPFETDGDANWMGRYFFTGGIMPSAELLPCFNRDLQVTRQWTWNGKHYQRTAEAWLKNLDSHRELALEILKTAYGTAESRRWLQRWRMFFLAVAELFGYSAGEEWFVSHYLLEHAAKDWGSSFRSADQERARS